ncbi:hypothetical protein CFP56_006186 [Quercus suber]|uniref:Secreted protein n=1 Tax=Quercus suber TaxID=58331 RepID=A0AAW0LA48_QUESU
MDHIAFWLILPIVWACIHVLTSALGGRKSGSSTLPPSSLPFSDHRKHPGAGQQTPSRCYQALQNLWTPYDSQAWELNNHSHFLSRHSQRSTAKK